MCVCVCAGSFVFVSICLNLLLSFVSASFFCFLGKGFWCLVGLGGFFLGFGVVFFWSSQGFVCLFACLFYRAFSSLGTLPSHQMCYFYVFIQNVS